MKIAIVCGHFIPTMGYVEVHLANAFHQLNHDIAVFTSHIVPTYVKNIAQLNDNAPYPIHRLNTTFSLGQMVKPIGLKKAITKFNPNLVICIGVGKLFPKPIYKIKNRSFKLLTLLGDNEETYIAKGSIQKLKNAIIQKTFKKKVYLKAIKKSDILLPYTPSTIDIIGEFIKGKELKLLKQKSKAFSLGFDHQQFYFDALERNEQRKKLGLSENDNLLITATRISPEKKIEKMIDLVDEINTKGVKLYYLIVGFQNDSYEKELKDYVAKKTHKNRFITQPFANFNQTRKYYNAADVAIFNRAAISIFEALATGLFLLLPNKKNISHILNQKNGFYFTDLNHEVLWECFKVKKEDRQKRVTQAKPFSYRNLANKIITISEI